LYLLVFICFKTVSSYFLVNVLNEQKEGLKAFNSILFYATIIN